MQCAACKADNDRVVDSRACEGGAAIRRRRECLSCGKRFTTYERAEQALKHVVKKDGRREPFSREKLLRGMRTACEKRQVSNVELSAIVDRLEADLFGDSDREVSARAIGESVIEALKSLDQVAYVRFASVYREFTDVSEFAKVVLPILSPDVRARVLGAPAGDRNGSSNAEKGGNGNGLGAADRIVVRKDGRNGNHPGGP